MRILPLTVRPRRLGSSDGLAQGDAAVFPEVDFAKFFAFAAGDFAGDDGVIGTDGAQRAFQVGIKLGYEFGEGIGEGVAAAGGIGQQDAAGVEELAEGGDVGIGEGEAARAGVMGDFGGGGIEVGDFGGDDGKGNAIGAFGRGAYRRKRVGQAAGSGSELPS